jgi:subtilisin family serine protease
MLVARHRLSIFRLSSVLANAIKSNYLYAIACFIFCAAFASAGLVQAQISAIATGQTTERIIVKIKPSLAQETEAQFSNTAQPGQPMHIIAGKSGNARIESFLRRQSALKLTPLYPQIIRLKKQHGWSDAQVAEHVRQHFAARAKRVAHPATTPEISRTYILEFDSLSAQEKASTLQRLKADPEVEFAEPEHTFTTKQIPNDPFLSSSGTWGQPYQDLWGLFAVNAPAAWDTAQGDGVVVAVIDTGVDYNHPDLADNIWTNPNEIAGNFFDDDGNGFADDFHGWNFVNNTNDPLDDNGHGTHVAGTIAAEGNNGIGVIGVAWHSKIMPLKGFDSSGTGFDFTLAPAIMYAANNGADVINASWDSFSSNMQVFGDSQTIEEAIQYAASLGVVFVTSAGNSSQDAANFFPANSPEAITVASSGPFGNFSFFSNFGPKIDVTAPGEDILSTQAANTFQGQPVIDGYARMTGTSMAAAHVSGVAALILSGNPALTAEQVRQIIHASSTSVPFDPRFGSGMLNAATAVTILNPLDTKITGVQFGASPIDPITILGSAQGTGFASYLLEYGAGTQPFSFTPFFSSVTPASGTLGQLDPSNLSDGVYTIRLTTFNTNGNAFFDTTQFTLVLCTITNPVSGTPPASASAYKSGVLLPIAGTAIVGGFQNFVVEWSPLLANAWQTAGITLAGNGTAPVVNGQLATWDTSAVAQAGFTQAGFYQIRVTVNGIISEQAFISIYLEPDLISPAFPVFFDLSPYFLNSSVVPALNPDGTLRLIMASPSQGTDPAASWVFNLDGSFQKTTLSFFGSNHQPAAGNLDGQPGDEAVVADSNVIRVIHPDNSFELFTPGVDVDLTNVPLLLDDLNNDFQLESITVGSDFNNNTAYVFAWRPDGQQANGFPIQVQDNNGLLKGSFNHGRVMVGDFDGDGSKEVLVHEGLTSTDYVLRLFGHDGTPKPFNAPVLTGVPFAMAAADLDHNGKLETILANYNGFLPTQATLHVFQPDGSERPGWPVDVSASNGDGSILASIAVGDFRRDGHEEIVLARDSSIYLLNSDGTLFPGAWPLPTHFPGYGPAVIGDVDGDGFPEIIATLNDLSATNGFRLLAIHSDGTIAKSWFLPGSNGLGFSSGFPAPVLGDFNQDGTTDIAVAYPLTANSGSNPGLVTILDTHVPFNTAQIDWPMNFQNPRNNPVLLRTLGSSLNVALTTGSNPSVPGDTLVFTASLTPNTGSGAIQFLDGGVSLSSAIPLTNGAASFTTSGLALGVHSITARYTGDNKTSAATSPVLVQTVARPSASVSLVLTAGANPASIGTALTFTAAVAPVSATGSVIFFDGSRAISNSVALSSGAASFTTSALGGGSHAITAQYSGDANFNGGTSPALVVNVLKTQTTVAVLLAEDSVKVGAPATFAAAITPGTATGTVIFFDGTVQISNPVAVSSGVARFTTTTLVSGTHSITALYSGDANFNGSTSNIAKLKVK